LKSLSYDGSDVDDPQSYRPSRADRALGAPDDPAQVAGRPWFNFARASQEFGFSRMSDDPDHPHFHLFRVLRADDDVDIDGTMGTGDPGEGNGAWDGERHADVSGDGVVNTVLGSQADARDFVAEQIERSTIGWAQAGIKVEMTGAINFDDAPDDAAGDDILIDGSLDFPGDTALVIDNTAGLQEDVFDVFFVPVHSIGANAFEIGPEDDDDFATLNPGENSFTFIGRSARGNTLLDVDVRTLAHELGHALDNINGSDRRFPNSDYVFYPADRTLSDVDVESYRRVRHDTEGRARRRRPSGNLNDPGNRVLIRGD